MVDVNRMTNPTNMRWKLIDRQTGAEGAAIDWRFRVGDAGEDSTGERDGLGSSDAPPISHPWRGAFPDPVARRVVEPNLVWKDTVLVPTGQTVDILLDVTHPGVWMAHCHIAEHHESGMMFSFRVDQVERDSRGADNEESASVCSVAALVLFGGFDCCRHRSLPLGAAALCSQLRKWRFLTALPSAWPVRSAFGRSHPKTLPRSTPARLRTLHEYLQTAFPRVHAQLRRETVGDAQPALHLAGQRPLTQSDPADRASGRRAGRAGHGGEVAAGSLRRPNRRRLHLGPRRDRQQVRGLGHARSRGDAPRRRVPPDADRLSRVRP